MTKTEMLTELVATIKWTDATKKAYIKDVTRRCKKERIQAVYNAFIDNRENAYFYACILEI